MVRLAARERPQSSQVALKTRWLSRKKHLDPTKARLWTTALCRSYTTFDVLLQGLCG